MEVIGNYTVVFRPGDAHVFGRTPRTINRLKTRPDLPKYVQEFIARKQRYNGWVYLIHFDRPYKHARHYLGFTKDVSLRELRHRAGNGSNLMRVVTEAGIGWKVVRVWYGDRYLERRLKAHSSTRYCPICKGQENENERKRISKANRKLDDGNGNSSGND